MKRRITIQILLGLVIIALGWVVVRQIAVPLRFDQEYDEREKAVIERIKVIRTAEWAYRQQHGCYTDNHDSLARYMADPQEDWNIIPYTEGVRFFLEAGIFKTASGVEVPVFECRAPYKIFLGDLDRQQLINLIDTYNKSERYPGIKVGSMEQLTNDAGSWE